MSHIEPLNIEQPLNLYPMRDSNFSEDIEVLGEDVNSNDNIIFQKDNSSMEMIDQKKKSGYFCIKGDSEFSCILNLAVSAIGGGCFSFPYIIYEGGIIISFIAFAFVTFSIYYSIDLMRSFVADTNIILLL